MNNKIYLIMLKKVLVASAVGQQQVVASRTALLVASNRRHFAAGTKLAKFDFTDALQLEELLTEDEKMVRDSARAYA